MRAFITVIGKDTVGILAKVCNKCAEYDINVTDVTQSVLQDMFTMIMLVDMSKTEITISALSEEMDTLALSLDLKIHVMHEDIFNSMHRI